MHEDVAIATGADIVALSYNAYMLLMAIINIFLKGAHLIFSYQQLVNDDLISEMLYNRHAGCMNKKHFSHVGAPLMQCVNYLAY